MREEEVICINCKETTAAIIDGNLVAYKCSKCGINVFDKKED
jgi:DNA-directed RNA polymerase subunit RPC12/RpoP